MPSAAALSGLLFLTTPLLTSASTVTAFSLFAKAMKKFYRQGEQLTALCSSLFSDTVEAEWNDLSQEDKAEYSCGSIGGGGQANSSRTAENKKSQKGKFCHLYQ